MADKDKTLNDTGNEAEVATAAEDTEAAVPSTVEESSSEDEDLLDTMAFTPVEPSAETLKPEGGKEEEEEEPKKEVEPEPKKEEPTPFHKHPKFQEMRTKIRDERDGRVKAEARLEALEETSRKDADLDFVDITKKTPDEIKEWMDEDPVGYHANLMKQAKYEFGQEQGDLKADLKAELKREADEARITKTYTKYAKDHSNFDEMWDSGEIKAYMDEHPGHTAISAHQVLTAQSRDDDFDKRLEKAVAKAKEDATKEAEKNFKAKGSARVLGTGPAGAGGLVADEVAPELKDPKKHGGVTTVLAKRLQAFRKRRAEARQ